MIEIPAAGEQKPGSTRTLMVDAGGRVRRSVLEPGVRVISEQMSATRSVSLGIWVPVGSRNETPRYAGASHFLEHLLFKGTEKRNAFDISSSIDAVGGELNAFTTKEYTCFYARVLDRDVPLAVEVLMDMMTASSVTAADVDAERAVVLEEIAMHDDDPADAAHELFSAQVFAGTALEAPIIGTEESISAMPRADVWRHYRRWYRPANLAVVAAGGVDHKVVTRAVRKALAKVPAGKPGTARPTNKARKRTDEVGSYTVRPREIEQANVVLGMSGLVRNDPRRWALGVLNAVLGGGMSSRLFQEVREKRGLAYSVQSFRTAHADAGAFAIYTGSMPAKVDDAIEVISSVLGDLARDGMTAAELERGKGQLRGGLVLNLEESSSRMVRLGEAELLTGTLLSVEEALAAIDAVTLEQVRTLAAELFARPRHLGVVGPFDADREFRSS